MGKSSLRQGMDHGKLLLLTDLSLTPIPNAEYAGNGKNIGNINMDAAIFIVALLFIAFAWGFQMGRQFNQRSHGVDQNKQ